MMNDVNDFTSPDDEVLRARDVHIGELALIVRHPSVYVLLAVSDLDDCKLFKLLHVDLHETKIESSVAYDVWSRINA